MIAPISFLLLTSVALTSARPLASPVWTAARREVSAVDQTATAQAQQRDDTATRAFTAQEIQVCAIVFMFFLRPTNLPSPLDLGWQVSCCRSFVW